MYGIDHRRATAFVAICLLMAVAASIESAAAGTDEDRPGPGMTRVDINRADATALAALPGVGPTLARRIVEFREQHGPFDRVEDLLKVKGIGEKSFKKLRSSVTVGAPEGKS